MCTMITHQAKIEGRGKNGDDWFEVREANVSYDHPYDLPLEHAFNIDFVNEAQGPGARVRREVSASTARAICSDPFSPCSTKPTHRGVFVDISPACVVR